MTDYLLPQALTNAVSPEAAVGFLLGVTGLALVIAAFLVVLVFRQHRTLGDLRADLKASNTTKDRIAEDNARMRAQRQMPPMPSRRPVPEPEQTLTLPRDPNATQRIPAHQPPTRTARHGEGT